jgi:excisionase family DNA binding protein
VRCGCHVGGVGVQSLNPCGGFGCGIDITVMTEYQTLNGGPQASASGSSTTIPDLLKPSEVAARLGVSRSWLYDAARVGRIPSIRIGGSDGPLRFVAEDLLRWIEDARRAPEHAGPV